MPGFNAEGNNQAICGQLRRFLYNLMELLEILNQMIGRKDE